MINEKITFGWDLCYTCNYRCPYCGVWKKESGKDIVMPPKEWERVWDRVHERYGSCHIYISGGEPSTYPYFFGLVGMLSRKHFPEICTNLSWDIGRLVPEIPSGRLRIAPTFHPAFADFDDFFEKLLNIKPYLPDSQVYYVAHPGQIKEMPERSEKLKKYGMKLVPMPLRENQQVLNTEAEKEIIRSVSPYKEAGGRIEYQLNSISPKGRLCKAGFRYAMIRADGRMDRCSQYENGAVGNFLGEATGLSDGPRPCEMKYCPIECQWITP